MFSIGSRSSAEPSAHLKTRHRGNHRAGVSWVEFTAKVDRRARRERRHPTFAGSLPATNSTSSTPKARSSADDTDEAKGIHDAKDCPAPYEPLGSHWRTTPQDSGPRLGISRLTALSLPELQRKTIDSTLVMVNSRHAARRRERSCGPGRALLVLALLPALLFAPALDGATVWVHAHASSGVHLHIHEPLANHEFGAHHERHEDEHRHGQDGGAQPDHTPAPAGFLIELPHLHAAAPKKPEAVFAAGARVSAPPPQRCAGVPWEDTAGPRAGARWRRPFAGSQRSGVAALLRSNHALLI